MIGSDVLRGYHDIMILCLLLEGDSYGYAVSKEIGLRSSGIYNMKETTLYSAFNRLEKNGFITSYYGKETFGRRRTYFKITPEGKQYYLQKCAEWKMTKQLINQFIKGEKEDE